MLPQRFWDKVTFSPGDCWEWTGSLRDGYGRFKINGVYYQAHRVMYKDTYGPIPKGLQLDHLCRTRNCVHPLHLEIVAQQTNILQGISPIANQARQTHCLNGHELKGDNLYYSPKRPTIRQCKPCTIARSAEQRRRKRG